MSGLEQQRHPRFWLDDGSVVLRVDNQLFKIHATLLSDSDVVQTLIGNRHGDDHDHVVVDIPEELGVSADDFVVLLEHLYHDVPMSTTTPFSRISSILRVSSSKQLNLPSIHALARTYLEGMFPSGPRPFCHDHGSEELEEAVVLAREYGVDSIRKGLYYSLTTTTNFNTVGNDGDEEKREVSTNPVINQYLTRDPKPLAPSDAQICRTLMTNVIAHFTPILFTPPIAAHMGCTDVFADKWMPIVIEPALESGDSVYKPLETLEGWKVFDWAGKGVCGGCVEEKRGEWGRMQEDVWERVGEWVRMGEAEDEGGV